jgi:hypothetical protein
MLATVKRWTPSQLRLFLRKIQRGGSGALSLLKYYREYRRYARTGVVPPSADTLLLSAYTLTNGRLTDFLAERLASELPPVAVNDSAGVMPRLSCAEFNEALTDLRRDGIHVFRGRVDTSLLEEVTKFAERTPCRPFGDHLGRDAVQIKFDPKKPIAPTYWFDDQVLAECQAVQRLLTEPTWLRLAQAYLGIEPILNIHTMWWSAAYGRSADQMSAQLFHFDLDRAKFLKVFVYLSDVGEENGPHVYVRGTHVRKARAVLRAGRISDHELFSYYPRERAITVTGPRGTVFAADTRGFHKGTPVVSGARLAFEVEFVTDRFGRSEPVIELNDRFSNEFWSWKARHPRVFCRFSQDRSVSNTAEMVLI